MATPKRAVDFVHPRLAAALVTLSLLIAACEDEGNPGDDNLFTGASLVVVALIVVVVVFMARRRRG
jgi:hypothetical protein